MNARTVPSSLSSACPSASAETNDRWLMVGVIPYLRRVFEAGEEILIRTVVGGRVRFAQPATCVIDDGATMAFFRPIGTPCKVPASYLLPRHSPEADAMSLEENRTGRWSHHDREWSGTNILVVARPDSWWSAWVMWSGDWDHLCWYVNVEVPLQRTPLGFDTRDLALDLVVMPDGEVIEKDRDEYETRLDHAVISPEHAARVESAVVEARQWVADRRPPFDETWVAWRPHPAWGIPQIPEGWDRA